MKKWREMLFDSSKPYHFHVGMRMIKTVVAVYICAIIGWLRGEEIFFAMIAAVICMQSSREQALKASFNRFIGTVIGALYGVLVLMLEGQIHLQRILPVYYLVLSLMLVPVIVTALALKKAPAAAFSCIVFLSIAVLHVTDDVPYVYALNRFLDTTVGIVVSLIVNLALPGMNKDKPEDEKK